MRYSGLLYGGLILILTSIVLWGCPKKSEITASPGVPKEQVTSASEPAAETGKNGKSASSAESSDAAKEHAMATEGSLQPIYFDFDKSFVRDDARSVMKNNAEWLKAHPKVKIRIEGNCDEQGTVEYNQALGQRRSVSAKRYLTEMGVASSRISLISFGKEKPVCTTSAESCWQKNRRDDFVLANQ